MKYVTKNIFLRTFSVKFYEGKTTKNTNSCVKVKVQGHLSSLPTKKK